MCVLTSHIILLLLVFVFPVELSNSNRDGLFRSNKVLIGDDSFINANFPIIADSTDSIAKISEQCLKDTKTQLVALQSRLPWAVESNF